MNAEILIRFTPHELDIVVRCLAKQPYETVVGVISKIQMQANDPEVQNPESFVHAPVAQTPTPPAVVSALTPMAEALIGAADGSPSSAPVVPHAGGI